MLMSVEEEYPVVFRVNGNPVSQDFFPILWEKLVSLGWEKKGKFGVIKNRVNEFGAVCSEQSLSMDSGPTIELSPSPAMSVQCIEEQTISIRKEIISILQEEGFSILGLGVHPILGSTNDEYYRYRTPRDAYDYAINSRGWNHGSIVNIAATQEVVDIPFGKSIDILRIFHRLCGVFLFLFRNDPEFINGSVVKSVRPKAWRAHVNNSSRFQSDKNKLWMPAHEIVSWNKYIELLWKSNPMFLLGTKDNGLAYIPKHPTFEDFLSNTPINGWKGITIIDKKDVCIFPETNHVLQTDWTYMGSARLRWFLREDFDIIEIVEAIKKNRIESFFSRYGYKFLIENRSCAAATPYEELASLAFVVGILQRFDDIMMYMDKYSYSFWFNFAHFAESANITDVYLGIVSVQNVLLDILHISNEGLLERNLGEEKYLNSVFFRVNNGMSLSENNLVLFEKYGIGAVLSSCSYTL
jgi:gamma-glutamylcysteine synthetase